MSRISIPVVVTSRTFSKHAVLKERLREQFSNIKFNDQGLYLSGAALVEFLQGRKAAIIGLEKVNDAVLKHVPGLKIIAKYGVGLDNLDLKALEKRGVKLGWTGGVNARSVAELALTFALNITRNVFSSVQIVTSGKWEYPGGFQLSGKTVGIVGCGFIGSDLVRLLQPFGCKVLVNDILDKRDFCQANGATQVELPQLLAESDIVSLHVPYDQSTHHMIGKKQFKTMKPSAILVNTARGNVVDEAALLEALKTKTLRGAGFDVFATEPPVNSPLLKQPGFFATPHIAGGTHEAIMAMGTAAITNLVRLCRELK